MLPPKENIILIADPFLQDIHFKRAVIYLCSHNNEGSFGFTLNNKCTYNLDHMIPDFKNHPIPLFSGGPVGIDSIHFIHQYPDIIPNAQKLSKDIFWGGDFDQVKRLILEDRINLKKIKFFIGYCGWGKGQLAEEIKEHTWLTTLSNKHLLFNTAPEVVWSESVKKLGPDYFEIIHYPIDPQLN